MSYIDISEERYSLLMSNEKERLTQEEMDDGWHWCWEMDGLLVNTKTPEFEFLKDCCKCIIKA